jgi:hypothetical protein
MEQRRVFARASSGVLRHHVVGGVHVQTVLRRDASSDGRFARTASATQPVDVSKIRLPAAAACRQNELGTHVSSPRGGD